VLPILFEIQRSCLS